MENKELINDLQKTIDKYQQEMENIAKQHGFELSLRLYIEDLKPLESSLETKEKGE